MVFLEALELLENYEKGVIELSTQDLNEILQVVLSHKRAMSVVMDVSENQYELTANSL